jgi:hypothetical protein
MTDIEEIPISAEDIPETTQDIPQDIPEKQTISDDIPKKGRGRPAGAKNKPKPKTTPKPKPKAKQKKPIEYVEYEEESEEEEAPPPRRRARQEPIELDRHALASEMLGILQQQRYQRTTAKRNHYASWFENMS